MIARTKIDSHIIYWYIYLLLVVTANDVTLQNRYEYNNQYIRIMIN